MLHTRTEQAPDSLGVTLGKSALSLVFVGAMLHGYAIDNADDYVYGINKVDHAGLSVLFTDENHIELTGKQKEKYRFLVKSGGILHPDSGWKDKYPDLTQDDIVKAACTSARRAVLKPPETQIGWPRALTHLTTPGYIDGALQESWEYNRQALDKYCGDMLIHDASL